MALQQLHNKPPPFLLLSAILPCPSTAVVQLLLLCFLLLSCSSSAAEPPDPSHNLTLRGAFDQLPGYLFLTNMTTFTTNGQRVASLASYIKANHPALNLSQKGWFFVRQLLVLRVLQCRLLHEHLPAKQSPDRRPPTLPYIRLVGHLHPTELGSTTRPLQPHLPHRQRRQPHLRPDWHSAR
ncbi:hypothetical protein BS78_05G242800 [Paspalum vaginatum]|nr:hypothetical protein BS78_05G242800 [Paspalum vaginatum]